MRHWITQYESWEGRAEELAELAGKLLARMGIPGKPSMPTERFIRHYVQKGILDRPDKRGREAYFGYRQLLQFLAAAILKSRGLSLQMIPRYTQERTNEELLELLAPPEENHRKTEAEKLVESFMAAELKTMKDREGRSLWLEHRLDALDHPPSKMERFSEDIPPLQVQEKVSTLGVDRCVVLNPAPWCRVYVNEKDLAEQPQEALHLLVGVFTSMLQAEWQRLRKES
jgi:DNA-binding transcriptional MerR regulator